MAITLYRVNPYYPSWMGGVEVVHGITGHLPKVNGRYQLERTGPYIPTFTNPLGGPLIVTEEGKQKLLDACFPSLRFELIDYVNIVPVDWETWDIEGLSPFDSREVNLLPTMIMDSTLHREDIAREMPKAYAVMSEHNLPISFRADPAVIDMSNFNKELFVNGITGVRVIPMVTEEGRDWFVENGAKWLDFVRFDRPKPPTSVFRSR